MRALYSLGVLLAASIFVFFLAVQATVELRPTFPPSPGFYLRLSKPETLSSTLNELVRRRVIRSTRTLYWIGKIEGLREKVEPGSYYFYPGMPPLEVFESLRHSTFAWVRFKEGYWIKRNAQHLAATVGWDAAEYERLAADASLFQKVVEAPIPLTGSLEGYLYPDRYRLTDDPSPRALIIEQLKNFEQKIWIPLGKPDRETLHRMLTVASMVQLEAARDEERPVIAGVIENRLRIQMPLHIDATVLYALQEWRNLKRAEYRSVKSPYNTYINHGLPPGPIGSPAAASVFAAQKPERHDYLFYVTTPFGDFRHIFAKTFSEHQRNIWAMKNISEKAVIAAGKFPELEGAKDLEKELKANLEQPRLSAEVSNRATRETASVTTESIPDTTSVGLNEKEIQKATENATAELIQKVKEPASNPVAPRATKPARKLEKYPAMQP